MSSSSLGWNEALVLFDGHQVSFGFVEHTQSGVSPPIFKTLSVHSAEHICDTGFVSMSILHISSNPSHTELAYSARGLTMVKYALSLTDVAPMHRFVLKMQLFCLPKYMLVPFHIVGQGYSKIYVADLTLVRIWSCSL